MTRKKLRLLALLAIGMFVWLLPKSGWAEDWVIKLSYDGFGSYYVRLNFDNNAKVKGSKDGVNFSDIPKKIIFFDKENYYIKGSFVRFTHDCDESDVKFSAEVKDCKALNLSFEGGASLEKVEITNASSLQGLSLYQYNGRKSVELKATNCPNLRNLNGEESYKSLELVNAGVSSLIWFRDLESLKANNCSELHEIDAKSWNKLKTLEAKNCEKLATVEVHSSQLTTLDLTGSKVTSLDVSRCAGLSSISGLSGLPLQTLKAENSGLTQIDAGQNNQLTTLEVKNCAKLATVKVHSSQLTALDLAGASKVTTLDISNCSQLSTIGAFDALSLHSLNVSSSAFSQITGKSALQKLEANNCSKLTRIDAKQCSQLTTLEAKNCDKLATVEVNSGNLTTLDLTSSKVTSLDVSSCAKLSSISGLSGLPLQTLKANNSGFTQIDAGQHTNLSTLEARSCARLATVKVENPKLTTLDLTGSKVTSLDVSRCAKLSSISGFSTLPLTTLKVNNSGLTTIPAISSLQTVEVKGCAALTELTFTSNQNLTELKVENCASLGKLNVSNSQKVKTVVATSCKEVNTEGCTALMKLEVGSSLQTLSTSYCTNLKNVEGTLSGLTTFTCNNNGFIAGFLGDVLEGRKASKLQVFRGNASNLPTGLVLNAALKELQLGESKYLSSLTVPGSSVLEDLNLSKIESLKELNVSNAKNLKKLDIASTGVKRISLEDLNKIESVKMPGAYPARLLAELICQLPNRQSSGTGLFSYNFGFDDYALVNGKVAKDKSWKITTHSGEDVTNKCTATFSCDDLNLPSSPDIVHLELAANTTVRLKIAKPTMLWQSETNDKTQFFDNHYYAIGNSDITLSGKTNVYLFTQPGALAEIVITDASKVKIIELSSAPELKVLELTNAALLTSLNITNQKELTKLKVTKAEKLTSIDLSQNTKLTKIVVEECSLTGSIDFSNHNVLTEVNLYYNKLSSVRLGNAITALQVSYNQLATLDLTPATGLKNLLAYNNKLTGITLAADKSKYEYIDIERNALVSFNLQNAVNVRTLTIHNNPNLADLNLRGCAKLRTLSLNGNEALKEIQKPGEDAWFLDGCNALRELKVYKTGLNATELTKLYCKLPTVSGDAKVVVVDKSDAKNLKEALKSGTKIAVDKGWKVLDKDENSFEGDKNRTCDDLKPHDVPVIELVVDPGETTVKFTTSAKELWIEDASGSFEYVDVTPGQEITRVFKPLFQSSYKFHSKITSFDITNQDKVKSLKIEKHDVLTELKASNCTGMVNVQLSNIANLAKLDINNSHVKELALATFPALRELNCAKNELKQLNFTANTLLEKVDCSENASLKTITALKSVGSAPAPLKELKCGGSGLSIEAFNQLFCLLPERTSDAKGKLFAVKDATEANEKLVPDNCYTSRATKKHWEILLNDGSTASLGNEASGDHACAPEKVKSIKMDPIAIEHHATLQLQPTIEPSYADNSNVKWTIKAGADKVKLYEGTVTILEALNVGTATLECVALDGGGAKTEVKVTVLEKQVKTITIKSSIPTPFHIGDKVQFTAEIAPADATYRDITWSVDGAAATIDATTGFLVAKTASTSLIVTAKNNSPEHQKTENYKVQINAPDVKGLKLSQNELVIKKDGKKYPVNVTLDPPSAHFNGTIKVTPADPVIAVTCTPQYDEYGFIIQPFKIEVEGITEGSETTVTIQPSAFPTLSATLKVKVVTDFVEPTDMELPATLTAIVGTPTKLEAKVLPETASNRAVLWSLKDAQSAEILSIDVEGNITPLKGGRATVVATAAGKTDLTKECIVDVSVDAIPSHVKLVTTLTVAKNEEIQLQVAGSGESYIKAESNVLQYTLSDAYTTVKVKSASGTIEVYGSLTKLEAKDAADKLTAITFTNDARLTELNVSGNSISELDLSALIDLQKLNCANNKLTRLNVIRLTNLTELNCGHNTISELDLIANANLEKLSCEALGLNILNLTTNARLKELVCYGNKFATAMYDEIYCTLPTTGGVMIPAKAKVAAGSDPNYDAMVASSSQLATQKSWKVIYEDQSDIQTTGTKTACESKPATGITIEPLSVKIGETKPIKYGLQPAGSTSLVSFKSQDETIATVDDKGNVKGVKAGTVDILITTDVPTVNGTCKVTVEEGKIELTGIAIEPLSVEIGKTKQIKYTLQPEGATANVTFKSQDETIATVDAQGNVTGVKAGTVKIDVTTDVADVKGTCDVTVTGAAIVPTGITIEPLSVKVGGTKQIKYTLQPEGATAKVMFKSQDETIATVDAQGNVKGVKVGKVKIDVTTDVAGVNGTCDVTVEKANAVEDAVFADVRVMPNPFETNLRIVLGGENRGVKYELINANGAVVRNGGIVANETLVETSELAAGVYILRLTSESGRTKSFKLIRK